MESDESDYGRGCVYCLGLFLAHADRYREMRKYLSEKTTATTWFNGAGDHLYELEIPEKFPTKLKRRLKTLQDTVLKLRISFDATEKDVEWAIDEAKTILMEIDDFMGIPTKKALSR